MMIVEITLDMLWTLRDCLVFHHSSLTCFNFNSLILKLAQEANRLQNVVAIGDDIKILPPECSSYWRCYKNTVSYGSLYVFVTTPTPWLSLSRPLERTLASMVNRVWNNWYPHFNHLEDLKIGWFSIHLY